MTPADLHPQESERLKELLRLEVLDTDDESALDELTELASEICGTPISLISLIDSDRQWFKSRKGLDADETSREVAFCSHAILQDEVFEVPNAATDERFHDNPLVTGAPDIRFYAGAPLVTESGMPIGTLCVIDTETHKLTEHQTRALKILANQVISQLELRLKHRQLEHLNKERDQIFAVMAHDLRTPFNGILGLSRILHEKANKLTPERLKQMADAILTSSMQVYNLLDELLQWSRNRLGAISISLEPITLMPVIMETVDFLKDAVEMKQQTIDLDVDHDAVVMADKALIKTVIRNLLSNAIKYSPEQTTIQLQGIINQDQVEIAIIDQGSGMSDEIKQKVFRTSVKSGEGTMGEKGHGLGLVLSAEFVRNQGGDIWVDEQYSPGTRVVFCLPLSNGHE
ncbi:GAF domain-containing sensor histidine kinase [Bermanella marisrubri]|uniref:histidine kinase n=1 Tax=Bermanella marisrubri TaxID=207949 RepID=Q1MZA9_9GAMM|nr:GAF domain-containing sensor histidine kinase [Bermanella marisrubri]EAT11357.1 hypothetical protein RED65_13057 [Oceanobacter sp. RED65] [Bermanella marisrubri]QIZ85257.1 GAF domain-containing sensor histidine kinase [Bermanella marisrubri]